MMRNVGPSKLVAPSGSEEFVFEEPSSDRTVSPMAVQESFQYLVKVVFKQKRFDPFSCLVRTI